jgi:hypothetical protein
MRVEEVSPPSPLTATDTEPRQQQSEMTASATHCARLALLPLSRRSESPKSDCCFSDGLAPPPPPPPPPPPCASCASCTNCTSATAGGALTLYSGLLLLLTTLKAAPAPAPAPAADASSSSGSLLAKGGRGREGAREGARAGGGGG